MCLTKITKSHGPNDELIEGYKIFDVCAGQIYGQYRDNNYKIGKHYKARGNYIHRAFIHYYRAGFHIYNSLHDALCNRVISRDTVYKVHGWDIRTEGTEFGHQVVVAQNMRIIEEIG